MSAKKQKGKTSTPTAKRGAAKESSTGSVARRKQDAGGKKSVSDAALMKSLKSYVRAKSQHLLANPQITSVGIGYSVPKGKTTPELSLQFTVDRTAVPQTLGATPESTIPDSIEVDGVMVPTAILSRTFRPSYVKVALQSKDPRKSRAEIVAPGMSVGNLWTSAGTIGAFVRDRESGKVMLLSNWHVLQGSRANIGVEVVQPGRHDDNRVDLNRIGQLVRSHLGAAGDCAIASVSGRSVSADVLELGVRVRSIGDPELGDRVVKSGRTTGVTYGRVERVEVNAKLNYGDGISETIGGFEIGIDPMAPPADGEISQGGDSGAAWLAVDADGRPTDVMLGLHFAGDDDGTSSEFALACYARSVMTALEVEPLSEAQLESPSLADGIAPRDGYDPSFVGVTLPVPRFRAARERDLAELDGSTEIPYCHFSVWLSKSRKYPLCVAWNIDGSRFKRLKRASFRVDRRGELEEFQLTNPIYVNNVLDRGHIARRADLCWGPLKEARQANYDSFYFTNIAPQHESFNQSTDDGDDPDGGVWGRLENTIFDSEEPHDLRISVVAGPVFSSKDVAFRQDDQETRLPNEFWKVIAFKDDRDGGEVKVYAFLLTQAHLVAPLRVPQGLELDEWLWARISLRELQERTGVLLGESWREHEAPFARVEALGATGGIRLLAGPHEYFS